ncbi:hypothetical protein ACLB2K_034991 [Fragaria x ananassa]
MYGLKSHDCHIMLQRLFPVFIRLFLPRQVVEPLVALARFFQKLCTREVKKSNLREMQENIIYIMCKFERIFPLIFFDIMPHLMIHLPEQLLLTGPVHYTWMYPMERQLGDYKDYVANKSATESSQIILAAGETADGEHRILRSCRMVGGMELTITVFSIQWWNLFMGKARQCTSSSVDGLILGHRA